MTDEEFYFINNFMIYEYQIPTNGLIVFYKNEKGDYYRVFGNYGNYHPDYLGDGIFSAAKYDFNEPPKANIKNVEEIKYRKTDFYRILADEFYRWYLQNEAFNNSSYNPDFDCLAAFVEIAKIFSKEDLRILRNTIYAKYGYEFKSADLNEIFSKCGFIGFSFRFSFFFRDRIEASHFFRRNKNVNFLGKSRQT